MISRMIQIKKNSGTNFNANLDPFTLSCMEQCREKLLCGGKRFSNAALIRTALRHYHEYIEMAGNREIEVEIKKALETANGSR